MQGNNLSNPAVIYDWIAWLSQTKDFQRAGHYRDPHELCDTTSRYVDKFGDPRVGTTPLADLLYHKGTILVAKIHKTLKDTLSPGTPLTEFVSVQFRSWATLNADFAAASARA